MKDWELEVRRTGDAFRAMPQTYGADIAGLCPQKDNCDVCRAARRNDAGYQEYLRRKGAAELAYENARTMVNAMAHDRQGGVFGHGNVAAVEFFTKSGA